MNLEAPPWLVYFHAAAALDSFPFFWSFALGWFWPFLHFKVRVWGVPCLIGPGLGWILRGAFCVLPTPPTQCWAMVWVIGPLH